MTWREISADQFNSLKRVTLIDVRSPCEYIVERIPGAVNIPLFTDGERDFIGTVYATEGEIIARRKAMNIIAPKIPALIDAIVEARGDENKPLVVHCWRGGLRSEAVASCLSIVGLDCFRLTGGYKSWRSVVVRDFAADPYLFEVIALQGHTGVGKTEILTEIEKAGGQVIDLEKLARHRGSVFGALAQKEGQPSQKDFEAAIWHRVRSFNGGKVYVEAESRNIGRVSLPAFLFKRLNGAPQILVSGSLERRCRRILADYGGNDESALDEGAGGKIMLEGAALQAAEQALATIQNRLPGAVLQEIREHVAAGDLAPAVELLLTHYYDHYYQKHIAGQNFIGTVSGDDPILAARDILAMG
ncbi:MAG: tRNA 2-selenouridine(34) synthase MnmH [Cyanobacteria bacterium REEB67]|nr:tRNA 2-selenouridine(34) synthase MnmH [Cyanobacteria bacterium REEB67]